MPILSIDLARIASSSNCKDRGQRIAVVTAWIGVLVLVLTAFVMVGRAYDVWRGAPREVVRVDRDASRIVAAAQPVSPRVNARLPGPALRGVPRARPAGSTSPLITVRVTFDSRSVTGAKATASSLVPAAVDLATPTGPWTDTGGMVQVPFDCVQEASESTPVKVLAYHPDFGTGLVETTLGVAQKGGLIDVKLERGSAVTGRVLGPDGKPVAGAFAQLSGMSLPETDGATVGIASLQGLGAIMNDDGVFTIPGIRF